MVRKEDIELSRYDRSLLSFELGRYYERYTTFPARERKKTAAIVEKIKYHFLQFIKKEQEECSKPYTFGNLMHQGSSYEALKVIKPDEFDLLLPLILEEDDWELKTPYGKYKAPGYFFIKEIGDTSEYPIKIVENGYLGRNLVKRNLQSVVHRAVNYMKDSDTGATSITLKEQGPAFPLRVWYDFNQEMSIDIVPAIRLNDRLFVSKRHPHATDSPLDLYNNMWRESFSKQEKLIIKTMDRKKECRKKCLKILKTIQIVNPSEQLRFLSSYHLKTCMLHLNNECVEPWDEEYIGDRFRDLLLVLNKFLERGVMESFFDPGIDLFAGLSEDGIQSTGGWLNKIVSSDDQIIEQLLHRVKQSESESLGSPEWRGMIDLNMNTYDDEVSSYTSTSAESESNLCDEEVFYADLEYESNSSVEALCSEDYNPAYYAPNEKVDIEAQRPLIHRGGPTEQMVEMKKPKKQRSCASCCLILLVVFIIIMLPIL